MKKITAISVFLVTLIFVLFPKGTLQPDSFLKAHKISHADIQMVLLGDSRSIQLKNFSKQIEHFFEKAGTRVNVHVYHQNLEVFISPCCPDKALLFDERNGFDKDSYYVYDYRGKLLERGRISESPGMAVQTILKKAYPDRAYQPPIEQGLEVGESILSGCETFLIPKEGLQFALFQESVCFSCPTGKRLLFFNGLKKDFPGVSFSYYYLQSHTPKPLKRMLAEAGIELPIHKPSLELLEFWQVEKKDYGVTKHPLDGVMVGIRSGRIVYLGYDNDQDKRWLEELFPDDGKTRGEH